MADFRGRTANDRAAALEAKYDPEDDIALRRLGAPVEASSFLGNFTNPIVIPGGFLILMIEDERQTKIETNVEKELDLIKREIANKQLNQFSNIYLNKIRNEIQINEF